MKKMLMAIGIALFTITCIVPGVSAKEGYHTVHFNYNGTTEAVEVADGELLIPIEDPVREGYVFYEWRDNRTMDTYDFSQPVTKNLTLLAQWRQAGKSDMTSIAAGNRDQSDITGINPDKEFKLTPEKIKIALKERIDVISISIAVIAVIVAICFAIAYHREKNSDRAKPTKKKEVIGTGNCHRCGKPYKKNAKICTYCGATIFHKDHSVTEVQAIESNVTKAGSTKKSTGNKATKATSTKKKKEA